ncbi:MAG: gliding motility protein GldN [Bacteroidetes bacterium]|jgi:gliding motility associated protien GldN|nr:gliding motility protein GldN [Bacteroidota bacterium]
MKRSLILFSFLLPFLKSVAQIKPIIALPSVREADVMWSKEIWRVIDVRDKLNFPFYFPLDRKPHRANLFQVLSDGVKSGNLKAYQSDELVESDTISRNSFFDRIVLKDSVTVYSADEFGSETTAKQWVTDTLRGEYILQYWVKELWFFDKQRSVMDVRIQAICPVKIDIEKEVLIPLFWIDYPNARQWLNSYTAINSKNEAEPRTFDELFIKRKFMSTIKKESNIYDREIAEYVETDKEAIQESERIKEYIRNFECDRWEY